MCAGEICSAPPCRLVRCSGSVCRAFKVALPPLSVFSSRALSCSPSLSVSSTHARYLLRTLTLSLSRPLTRRFERSIVAFLLPCMCRLVHHIHVSLGVPHMHMCGGLGPTSRPLTNERPSFRNRLNACCTDCYGMKGNMIWSGNEVSLKGRVWLFASEDTRRLFYMWWCRCCGGSRTIVTLLYYRRSLKR